MQNSKSFARSRPSGLSAARTADETVQHDAWVNAFLRKDFQDIFAGLLAPNPQKTHFHALMQASKQSAALLAEITELSPMERMHGLLRAQTALERGQEVRVFGTTLEPVATGSAQRRASARDAQRLLQTIHKAENWKRARCSEWNTEVELFDLDGRSELFEKFGVQRAVQTLSTNWDYGTTDEELEAEISRAARGYARQAADDGAITERGREDLVRDFGVPGAVFFSAGLLICYMLCQLSGYDVTPEEVRDDVDVPMQVQVIDGATERVGQNLVIFDQGQANATGVADAVFSQTLGFSWVTTFLGHVDMITIAMCMLFVLSTYNMVRGTYAARLYHAWGKYAFAIFVLFKVWRVFA